MNINSLFGVIVHSIQPAQAVTNEDRLFEWVRKNPTASTIPSFLEHVAVQAERGKYSVNSDSLNVPNYDIYQIEREIEADFLAKSERHLIRQKLADYIEKGIAGNPYYEGLYAGTAAKLRVARSTGCVGIDSVSSRHITLYDDKVNCVRLCPDEAREDTQRIIRKYAPEVSRLLAAHPEYRAYYAVYTEPNVPAGQLKEGKQAQYRKFSNMHRSKWGKSCLKGSFVIQEDPLATNSKDWNVHLNVIHIVHGRFDFKTVRSTWGNNVEIRQLTGKPEDIAKTFLEVVKYAAKHIGEKSADGQHTKSKGMIEWSFDQWHEWFVSGKGFRRSRTYGCLYKFDGMPDKGIDLANVEWVGTVRHTGTRYKFTASRRLSAVVDLIQADNFASGSSSLAIPPDDFPLLAFEPPY